MSIYYLCTLLQQAQFFPDSEKAHYAQEVYERIQNYLLMHRIPFFVENDCLVVDCAETDDNNGKRVTLRFRVWREIANQLCVLKEMIGNTEQQQSALISFQFCVDAHLSALLPIVSRTFDAYANEEAIRIESFLATSGIVGQYRQSKDFPRFRDDFVDSIAEILRSDQICLILRDASRTLLQNSLNEAASMMRVMRATEENAVDNETGCVETGATEGNAREGNAAERESENNLYVAQWLRTFVAESRVDAILCQMLCFHFRHIVKQARYGREKKHK